MLQVSAGESRHASASSSSLSSSSSSSTPFRAASLHGLATDHESASKITETDLSGLLDDTGTGIQGRRLLQRQSKAERTATVRGAPSDPARAPGQLCILSKLWDPIEVLGSYTLSLCLNV